MSKSRNYAHPDGETATGATTGIATSYAGTSSRYPQYQSRSLNSLLRRTNSAPLPNSHHHLQNRNHHHSSRSRPPLTGVPTISEAEDREVTTPSEFVKSRNGSIRFHAVGYSAKSGLSLKPSVTALELGYGDCSGLGEVNAVVEQEQHFDHTTAATVATSSPVPGDNNDWDTDNTVTDRNQPTSIGAIDTDQTVKAPMKGTEYGRRHSVTSESGQDVGDVEGEQDEEDDDEQEEEEEQEDEEEEQEDEEEDEEEEMDKYEEKKQATHYQRRRAEKGPTVTDKIINDDAHRINRQLRYVQVGGEGSDQENDLDYYEEGYEDRDGDDGDRESVATDCSEDPSEGSNAVDETVLEEMDNFRRHFKGIDRKFRLITKIGEGTFSSVYKAEDLLYDRHENGWDWEVSDHSDERSPPPNKRRKFAKTQRRRPKYVAIKKIYVTSSPQRIMNELELLHELQGCRDIVPLITAFRHLDQVVAILPYFRHIDFKDYFRSMKIRDMQLYFKSLFNALSHVHRSKIIHRDIKPTNFLYDYSRGRGVLVDFGLAEREGTESSYCPCQSQRKRGYNLLATTQPPPLSTGYIKNDNRPSQRANRAGTRGFRAPEVLLKCTSQTTKIDIWSAGVVLLIMLSKRFPFFNSADDVDATIEITTIFGKARMRSCALLHGAIFETNIPTIGEKGFTLEKIIMWATNRIAGGSGKERERDEFREANMPEDEKLACEFLSRCLELDPEKRLSAEEALQHDFLTSV